MCALCHSGASFTAFGLDWTFNKCPRRLWQLAIMNKTRKLLPLLNKCPRVLFLIRHTENWHKGGIFVSIIVNRNIMHELGNHVFKISWENDLRFYQNCDLINSWSKDNTLQRMFILILNVKINDADTWSQEILVFKFELLSIKTSKCFKIYISSSSHYV